MNGNDKQQLKHNLSKLATMKVSKRDKVAWWAVGISIAVLVVGSLLRQG